MVDGSNSTSEHGSRGLGKRQQKRRERQRKQTFESKERCDDVDEFFG
jgi:hypothetical protein